MKAVNGFYFIFHYFYFYFYFQNAVYGGVAASNGNTQVQIQDYSFSNGNCSFEVMVMSEGQRTSISFNVCFQNGYITENGQTRQANQQDLSTVAQYKQTLSNYMKQLNSNVSCFGLLSYEM